jgi:hypothetical protein
MRTTPSPNLERTPLSQNISHYTDNELRNVFRRLNPFLLNKWLSHFIEKEEYEVCKVIKEVMDENRI